MESNIYMSTENGYEAHTIKNSIKHIVASSLLTRCYQASSCNILLMHDIWGKELLSSCNVLLMHDICSRELSLLVVMNA